MFYLGSISLGPKARSHKHACAQGFTLGYTILGPHGEREKKDLIVERERYSYPWKKSEYYLCLCAIALHGSDAAAATLQIHILLTTVSFSLS